MTSIREAEELVKKAERGEWSLECDGQVLELMQKVANVRIHKIRISILICYCFTFLINFLYFNNISVENRNKKCYNQNQHR